MEKEIIEIYGIPHVCKNESKGIWVPLDLKKEPKEPEIEPIQIDAEKKKRPCKIKKTRKKGGKFY